MRAPVLIGLAVALPLAAIVVQRVIHLSTESVVEEIDRKVRARDAAKRPGPASPLKYADLHVLGQAVQRALATHFHRITSVEIVLPLEGKVQVTIRTTDPEQFELAASMSRAIVIVRHQLGGSDIDLLIAETPRQCTQQCCTTPEMRRPAPDGSIECCLCPRR